MSRTKWTLGLLTASAALLVACGGSDLECGAGTVAENGQCVPDTPSGELLECGTGTVADNGRCVPEDTLACGAGTVRVGDSCVLENEPLTCAAGATEMNGMCVPDVACGPDTMADAEGNCVPTFAEITCEAGTIEMDGTCIPDLDSLCAPGTTAREGQCLTDTDVLLADADITESMDENDPLFGGAPETLTLPDVGDSLIVRGGFGEPIDRSGDGVPEQDVDTYSFTASAGKILRVKILDAGAGTTAFSVTQEDSGYVRFSPSFQSQPEREMVLTANGDFTITISKNSFFEQPTVGPQGGEGFDYVMTIEDLGTPDLTSAVALDASAGAEAQGMFMGLGDNLFQIQGGANDYVRTRISDVGPGVQPVFVALDGSGAVIGELPFVDEGGFVRRLAVADDLAVLVDYVALEGRFNDFTISASLEAPEVSTETLRAGETLSLVTPEDELTLDPLTGQTWAFDAVVEERSVLFYNYSNNGPMDLRIYGEGGVLGRELDFARGAVPFPGVVVLNSGTFSAEYFNQSDDAFAGVAFLDVTLSPIPQEQVLGQVSGSTAPTTTDLGDITAANLVKFLEFEATAPTIVTATAEQTATQADILVFIVDADFNILGAGANSATEVAVDPGQHFVAIFNTSDGLSANGVGVTMTYEEPPALEMEPNDNPATATMLMTEDEPLGATLRFGARTDLDFFEISPALFNQTGGAAVPTAIAVDLGGNSIGLSLELIDDQGNLYGSSSVGSVAAVLQPGDPAMMTKYYAVVSRDAQSITSQNYTITVGKPDLGSLTAEVEANDTQMDASTIPLSFMPGQSDFNFGGAGTLVGADDEDWHTFRPLAQGFFTVRIEALEGAAALSPNLEVEIFQADGAGMLNPVDLLPLNRFEGNTDYFIKISGGNVGSIGTSYAVFADSANVEDLGALQLGTVLQDEGSIPASGSAVFSFTVPNGLPLDGSEVVFAWAGLRIDVLDASFREIYTAPTLGFVNLAGWSSDLLPSGQALAAGTYFARVSGDGGDTYDLRVGYLSASREGEDKSQIPPISNDQIFNGATVNPDLEQLGTLSTDWTYSLGTLAPATDTTDAHSFVVPDAGQGAQENIEVEIFPIGESVGATGVELFSGDGSPGPLNLVQVQSSFAPGQHFVQVSYLTRFFPGAPEPANAYILRVRLAPPSP